MTCKMILISQLFLIIMILKNQHIWLWSGWKSSQSLSLSLSLRLSLSLSLSLWRPLRPTPRRVR